MISINFSEPENVVNTQAATLFKKLAGDDNQLTYSELQKLGLKNNTFWAFNTNAANKSGDGKAAFDLTEFSQLYTSMLLQGSGQSALLQPNPALTEASASAAKTQLTQYASANPLGSDGLLPANSKTALETLQTQIETHAKQAALQALAKAKISEPESAKAKKAMAEGVSGFYKAFQTQTLSPLFGLSPGTSTQARTPSQTQPPPTNPAAPVPPGAPQVSNLPPKIQQQVQNTWQTVRQQNAQEAAQSQQLQNQNVVIAQQQAANQWLSQQREQRRLDALSSQFNMALAPALRSMNPGFM